MCLFCRSLLSLFLTGIAVELTLSPIALYHFHQSGILCAFANIVAIPLTTFVIMPVEALALLLDLVGLGAPAWWITGQAPDLMLALAHFIASRPGSMAMLPVFPEWTFALVVFGGLRKSLWGSGARYDGLVQIGRAHVGTTVTNGHIE